MQTTSRRIAQLIESYSSLGRPPDKLKAPEDPIVTSSKEELEQFTGPKTAELPSVEESGPRDRRQIVNLGPNILLKAILHLMEVLDRNVRPVKFTLYKALNIPQVQ